MTTPDPPQLFPDRSVPASFRGFIAQVLWTVLRWLDLKPNEVLVCEGDEDIVKKMFDNAGRLEKLTAEQIKEIDGRLSARSQEVHETIFAFLCAYHSHASANRECSFVFTTSASVAEQQVGRATSGASKRRVDLPIDILEHWRAWAAGANNDEPVALVDAIRRLVHGYAHETPQQHGNTKKKGRLPSITPARIHAALDYLDWTQGAWEKFLAAVKWNFDQPSEEQLLPVIIARVQTDARMKVLPAQLFARRLSFEVLETSAQAELGNRELTPAKLASLSDTTRDELVNWSERVHPERLEAWRREVESNLASHGEQLATLGAKVAELAAVSVDSGRTGRTASALHQLRTPSTELVGRERELADIVSALKSSKPAIVAITGNAGIGKTALAVTAAHAVRAHYPDAQIDIDLRGASKEPLSPDAVMAHVIRAFDRFAPVPTDTNELRALYRSVLDGKRVILLLDNAHDLSQIELLQPPNECALLVTSRRRFSIPGMHRKDLGPLSSGDAENLIRKIVPELDSVSLKGLVALCGGLPFALDLAGRTLAEKIDLDPGEYIKRLRDTRERVTLVEAPLSLSFTLLDQRVQEFWLRLAVFAGDFCRESAAYVARMHAVSRGLLVRQEAFGRFASTYIDENALAATSVVLSDLVRQNLVEFDQRSRRYRLHDLSRAFALSRISAQERHDAEYSHSMQFAGVAQAAEHLFAEGGDSQFEGIALFDRERVEIEAGHAWAAANANTDPSAAFFCAAYALYALECVGLRLPLHTQIEWLVLALDCARTLESGDLELSALSNLGITYDRVGDYSRAESVLTECLKLAREFGDSAAEGRALGNLGICAEHLGQFERAIELHERHLELARSLGDQDGEAKATGNLGAIYLLNGNLQKALQLRQSSLKIFQDQGDKHEEAIALAGIGKIHEQMSQDTEAIDCYKKSLDFYARIKDHKNQLGLCYRIADCHRRSQNFNQAIQFYQRCCELARLMDIPSLQIDALYYTAYIYDSLGDLERSVASLRACIEVARQTDGFPTDQLKSLEEMLEWLLSRNE